MRRSREAREGLKEVEDTTTTTTVAAVPAVAAASTTNNKLPNLGLGTFRLKGDSCTNAVVSALNSGYRLIDGAESYNNTEAIVNGIKRWRRENPTTAATTTITVTTKVAKDSVGKKDGAAAGTRAALTAQAALLTEAKPLEICAMLHWPGTGNNNTASPMHKTRRHEAYQALVDEKKSKQIFTGADGNGLTLKTIGVSNFTVAHLTAMIDEAKLPVPEINQFECHPYCQERELREFCNRRGIQTQAFCSLGRSTEGPRCLYGVWEPTQPKLVNDAVIKARAKELGGAGVSPELMLLRWGVLSKMAVIPKCSSAEHIADCAKAVDEDFWKGKSATWFEALNAIEVPGKSKIIRYAFQAAKFPQ